MKRDFHLWAAVRRSPTNQTLYLDTESVSGTENGTRKKAEAEDKRLIRLGFTPNKVVQITEAKTIWDFE